MSKDLQSQATIFGPDSARPGDELKPNQPKDFSYPKRNFSKNGKDERSFLPSWYETLGVATLQRNRRYCLLHNLFKCETFSHAE